jgi:hypothetical protein
MDKQLRVSAEALQWLRSQAVEGESIDALIRRWAGLTRRRIGAVRVLKGETIDGRKKWPIIDMVAGSELIQPWIEDAQTGQRDLKAMRAFGACVARCNRISGRVYRATPTASGVHVVRIA